MSMAHMCSTCIIATGLLAAAFAAPSLGYFATDLVAGPKASFNYASGFCGDNVPEIKDYGPNGKYPDFMVPPTLIQQCYLENLKNLIP